MDFVEECVHFQEFTKEAAPKEHSGAEFLKIIVSRGLVATFPNVDTIFQIFFACFVRMQPENVLYPLLRGQRIIRGIHLSVKGIFCHSFGIAQYNLFQ